MTPDDLSPELARMVAAAANETANGLPDEALERVRRNLRTQLAPAPKRSLWPRWSLALGLCATASAAALLVWWQDSQPQAPLTGAQPPTIASATAEPTAPTVSSPAASREGRLVIRNEPANLRATVYLDGHTMGTTPLTLQVAPGRHVLRLEAAGYVAREQSLEVLADVELPVTLVLGKLAPSPTVRGRQGGEQDADWKHAEDALAKRDCRTVARLTTNLVKAAKNSDERADAWLLDAECQLRAGNLGEARARFDALRTREPKSQAAETALFQAANLAVRMRDNGVALTLLTDYTSQYPNGLYHFAALERRCEVLLGNNALTEARQCLQGLQARYPTQSRAQDALLLLARLASREGRDAECVELLTAYLEEHPRSSRDADARLEQVRCARRAHHAEVDRFVREYLERYPNGRLEAPAHKDALP